VRIGLITTSFPREEGDIPGTFVLGFARALVARGHTFEVLAPEPHEARYDPAPSWQGIELRWVRYLPRELQRTFYGAGVLDNFRRDPRAWLGPLPFVASMLAAAAQRAQGWDAVVSHWALPSALIAGQVRGTRRHLAVLHSADVHLIERLPASKLLADRVARSADTLLFSSRDLRRRFLACLDPMARIEVSARAHVSAMGIVPHVPVERDRETLRAELSLSGCVVLSLGRLVPIKGVDTLIRAVARQPELSLVVAGDGPERSSLQALAASLGANVRFVGEVRDQEKRAWLEAADLFVLPSRKLSSGRTEGMPITLLEAMGAGLPVVATQSGGLADLIEHEENGLLVASDDVAGLRAAILRMRDPALRERLALNARETAEDYAWPALAPRFEALLFGESPC